MPTLKQIIFASMLVSALLATAAAQDSITALAQSSSLTITAAATADRVRITAPSSIVQMHVEVYAASGEKLFDQEIRGGNVFDWHLQDGQAQRLAPGIYVCVVTVKSISGKLTQRIGTVSVEEKSVSVQAADSRQLSAAQAQPIGPVEENPSWTIAAQDEPQTPTVIANDGTDGQMIRGRGALTFRLGNFFSGIDTEQMRLTEAGNLGIGTSEPKAKLEVAGTIRAERFLVAKPDPRGSNALAGDSAQVADDAGSVQPLVAGTGTQNQIAKWIDNSATLGNSGITETATGVGIGTPTPTQALDVANGRIVTTGSQALAGAFDSMLEVKSTITNNGLAQSAIKARNIFNGSGDFVTGLDVAPTFAPSASISTAQGFVAGAFFAPPPGVTITNANGGASATVYSNTTGAVTNGAAFNIVSPFLFGSLKPTNQYGLRIGNQGISGTTNSYGLFVDAQSGSTNSYSAIFAGGSVGIGMTPDPAIKLDVSGSTRITPGNGYSISFGAPNGETGMTLLKPGISRADVRFNGTTLSLFASNGVVPPCCGITVHTSGNVGIANTNPTAGRLHVTGGANNGVYGDTTNVNGVGLYGAHATTGVGVLGTSSGGVGVKGDSGNDLGTGVAGFSVNGFGVTGYSPGGKGVEGTSTVGIGVSGKNTGQNPGVYGESPYTGVFGKSTSGVGVYGESNSNVGDNSGIYGHNSAGGFSGYFTGKVQVNGLLSAGGCNGCSPPSDRNLKANFSAVNQRLILDRLATIPIQSWNYKTELDSVRHIGAMAQDFRAAFGLGNNDTTLNTVDANGVTMAAVQGLYQMMQEKDKQIERLQERLRQVERRVRRSRN